jgi:phage terminase Nu1 subunit (DNA packaging protein)
VRCNRTKLAKILGHDVKTIDRMVQDGVPYVSKPGDGQRSWVFETRAVLKWMMRDELAEKNKASRSRLLEAKAGLKWLEYGKALGLLVNVHQLMDKLIDVPMMVKSRLYAMPGRFDQLVANESDPAVIEQMLQKEIDDIIDEMDRMAKVIIEEEGRAERVAARSAGLIQ